MFRDLALTQTLVQERTEVRMYCYVGQLVKETGIPSFKFDICILEICITGSEYHFNVQEN